MTELTNLTNITVYVANLGRYNEGCLVGGWITLPVPQTKLDTFLKETVGLELDSHIAYEKGLRGERVYEEYAIHDYEYNGGLEALGYTPSEYTNLDDLNILAATLVSQSPAASEFEAIRLCAEQNAMDSGPLDYANLVLQADEIPFYGYDFEEIQYADTWTNEEKLGRTLLEGSPIINTLNAANLLDYFDFERYGSDHAHNCTLADEGYLDCAADFPDLDFYDEDELKEMAADQLGEDDYFTPSSQSKEKRCEPLSLESRCNGVSRTSSALGDRSDNLKQPELFQGTDR